MQGNTTGLTPTAPVDRRIDTIITAGGDWWFVRIINTPDGTQHFRERVPVWAVVDDDGRSIVGCVADGSALHPIQPCDGYYWHDGDSRCRCGQPRAALDDERWCTHCGAELDQ